MRQKVSGGIPLTRKLCYAAGGVPYQLTSVAIGVSLQIFLLEVAQLEAFSTSIILFVSRTWDAVTDPLVGYLVSRSKRTAIGKLTPWVVLSMPFGVLSYVLLWFVPQVKTSLKTTWFVAAACLFETLMSGYNVPYLSLGMFLGGDQRDRDSATAYSKDPTTHSHTNMPALANTHAQKYCQTTLQCTSCLLLLAGMSVEMIAMLLASVIQGQVVALYNREKQETCEQLEHDGPPSSSPPHVASLQETQKAFLISSMVIGGLFFISSIVLFLGVKEQQGSVSSTEKTSLGSFALFCSHAAGLSDQFQHLLLALLVSASIAVPLWQVVLLRIGKKATVFIGLSLFIPASIFVACVPSNFPVFMMMCVLMGFSVATIFLLPWSMLPDVVDDFAMTYPSCKDLEPLFFSCYAFCNKLAGGLAVGLSTLILQFVGYRAGACHQGDRVVTALIVLFSPVPIVLLLIGMMFFRSYPINERKSLSSQEAATADPEAPSSSSKQRENAEQPAGVTAMSHLNIFQKSKASPRPGNHVKNDTVRLSVISIDLNSANDSKSVFRSGVNNKCDRQSLSTQQSLMKVSRCPKKRAKVSWV
ncbi:sodium-dependent lysophosphatidylcholine symporter 1-B-like isoform X2 [Dunckerocampus dactyliophorus]|uniref:sodium-dependent lysophosphatidylcholine symporter 1-B-like isoform X2 n=1 Tax=Dunckerocampus dactyliophorus TaxID=161453 RepID=UPI002406683C|nr:sodium-dependent lysophosphatidylcholine symporter 1-B-like isoform X2 [Dunckerocampus dactyliophorus]